MLEPHHLSGRSLAATLPVPAVGSAPAAALAASTAANGDAVLLALGRQWDAVQEKRRANDAVFRAMSDVERVLHQWADQARADILFDQAYALFDEIVGMPARSISGLQLKARIVADECEIEGIGAVAIERALQSSCSLLEKAALSLALDLSRLKA